MHKANSRRATRLEESIIKELGRIFIEEVQDPRLNLVTISGARLNPDLSIAEILYTHSGLPQKQIEVQKALESAQGFLRTQLSKRLKIRYIPQLRFRWDNYLENMIYVSSRPDSEHTKKP